MVGKRAGKGGKAALLHPREEKKKKRSTCCLGEAIKVNTEGGGRGLDGRKKGRGYYGYLREEHKTKKASCTKRLRKRTRRVRSPDTKRRSSRRQPEVRGLTGCGGGQQHSVSPARWTEDGKRLQNKQPSSLGIITHKLESIKRQKKKKNPH